MFTRLLGQCFLINFGVSKDAAHFYPLRKNRSVRFGFSVATVLLACRGDQVSFNTTVGVCDVILKSAAAKTIALDRAFTY